MREWPDDATCLEWLWRTRHSPDGKTADCPKCETDRTFKRYEFTTRRQSWTCTGCGHHIHPTAGTIFEKSSTSLHLWFYAMYLMTSTRCGISAKQLERDLGVKYKTAWRMFNKIRNQLMADDGVLLTGEVEADETLLGGKIRNDARRRRDALGWSPKKWDQEHKTMVFAAVERHGRVRVALRSARRPKHDVPRPRERSRYKTAGLAVLWPDGSDDLAKRIHDFAALRHRDLQPLWRLLLRLLRLVGHSW